MHMQDLSQNSPNMLISFFLTHVTWFYLLTYIEDKAGLDMTLSILPTTLFKIWAEQVSIVVKNQTSLHVHVV